MRVHLPMSPRAVIAEVVTALEQAELEAGTIAPLGIFVLAPALEFVLPSGAPCSS
jgi:hypothetical protein